jgi:hypothetical protein
MPNKRAVPISLPGAISTRHVAPLATLNYSRLNWKSLGRGGKLSAGIR